MCSEGGADLTYTEMVSAAGLAHGPSPTRHLLETMPGEGPVAVQLFGATESDLAFATRFVENFASRTSDERRQPVFAEINLNAGCPMTKVTREGAELMTDKEVQRHAGIYEFLLSDRTLFEKLNLRTFDPDDMRVAYERQQGVCPVCKKHFSFEEMRGDHIKPWSKGGKTTPENLQMLCADCNARKSDKF